MHLGTENVQNFLCPLINLRMRGINFRLSAWSNWTISTHCFHDFSSVDKIVDSLKSLLDLLAASLSLSSALDGLALDLREFIDLLGAAFEGARKAVQAGRSRLRGFAFQAQVGRHAPIDLGDPAHPGRDVPEVVVGLLDGVGLPDFDDLQAISIRGCHHLPPPEPVAPCEDPEFPAPD